MPTAGPRGRRSRRRGRRSPTCSTPSRGQIVLTSGGSEADNQAVFGLAGPAPGRLVVSAIEHPAVREPALELERRGFEVAWAPVDGDGVIDARRVRGAASAPATALAAAMWANNVTGVVQPIARARGIAARAGRAIPLRRRAGRRVVPGRPAVVGRRSRWRCRPTSWAAPRASAASSPATPTDPAAGLRRRPGGRPRGPAPRTSPGAVGFAAALAATRAAADRRRALRARLESALASGIDDRLGGRRAAAGPPAGRGAGHPRRAAGAGARPGGLRRRRGLGVRGGRRRAEPRPGRPGHVGREARSVCGSRSAPPRPRPRWTASPPRLDRLPGPAAAGRPRRGGCALCTRRPPSTTRCALRHAGPAGPDAVAGRGGRPRLRRRHPHRARRRGRPHRRCPPPRLRPARTRRPRPSSPVRLAEGRDLLDAARRRDAPRSRRELGRRRSGSRACVAARRRRSARRARRRARRRPQMPPHPAASRSPCAAASTRAVALLKAVEAGLEPVGVTLRLWIDPAAPDGERACCSPRLGAGGARGLSRAGRAALRPRPARRVPARGGRRLRRRIHAAGLTPEPVHALQRRASASPRWRGSPTGSAPARIATGHYARVARAGRADARRPRRRPGQGPVLHAGVGAAPRSSSGAGSRWASRRRPRRGPRRAPRAWTRPGGREPGGLLRRRRRSPRRSSSATAARAAPATIVDRRGRGARPPRRRAPLHARPAPRDRRGRRRAALRPRRTDAGSGRVVVGAAGAARSARRCGSPRAACYVPARRVQAKLRYRTDRGVGDGAAVAGDGFALDLDEPVDRRRAGAGGRALRRRRRRRRRA